MSMDKLQKKATKSAARYQKARAKLPHKVKVRIKRVYDSGTGKVSHKITTEKIEKKPTVNLREKAVRAVKAEAVGKIHSKIAEAGQDNIGIEAAHGVEQKIEGGIRFVNGVRGTKLQRKRRKVKRLKRKSIKANAKYQYKKFLEENPQYKHKLFKRQLAKRRIKKNYTEKLRKQAMAGTQTLFSGIKKIFESKKKTLAGAGIIMLLFSMLASSLGSCTAMFAGGGTTTTVCSYASPPEELDKVDADFRVMELELQKTIDNVERDHPGYDEYRYNLGEIGHDPFDLLSYLSAKNQIFTHAGVQSQITDTFHEMYTLSYRHVQETRTRTERRTGHRTVHHADGTTSTETYHYDVEVEYTVDILETTLTVKDLRTIATGHLSADEQLLYTAYGYTHGGLQQFASPLKLYWYNYVSSYYGKRKNPVTGAEEDHKGIDIKVPDDMDVYAGLDGAVTDMGNDSYYGKTITIKDDKGHEITYAHLSDISVANGQVITKGMIIGKTGHSGTCAEPHLHLEVKANGVYYNPMYYFDAENGTLYGEGPNNVPPGGITPPAVTDETARKLLDEADKYIGRPYVWGGSSPATSFDCSGFMYWIYNHTGVKSFARTTAQGLYNMCTPVSLDEAKPGDLIFFTRTYNSGTPVTHVGMYCGGGVFVHAGDPIKYSSVSSNYWTSHYYSCGRFR